MYIAFLKSYTCKFTPSLFSDLTSSTAGFFKAQYPYLFCFDNRIVIWNKTVFGSCGLTRTIFSYRLRDTIASTLELSKSIPMCHLQPVMPCFHSLGATVLYIVQQAHLTADYMTNPDTREMKINYKVYAYHQDSSQRKKYS